MRRHIALLTLCLLIGLVSVPIVLTWRQVRQEQLNHALIAAVDRNDTAGVHSLLRQGADPNAQVRPEDKRPVWKRVWDIVRYRSSLQSLNRESALLRAVKWLPDPNNPAYVIDNVDTVKALITSGANVNVRSGSPEDVPLVAAAAFGKFETMKVLLAHHANVNARNASEQTALWCAALEANPEMISALLSRGAEVNAADNYWHETSLTRIVKYRRWNKMEDMRKAVACLLQHGASLQAKDSQGKTILMLAHDLNDPLLIRMLKQAGAQ